MSAVVYGTPRLDHDVVTSTNDIARAWALAGIDSGALVTATSQTRGRGRRGAKWQDKPGQCAIMSFVAEPVSSVEAVWRVPFTVSLAVCRAAMALGVSTARTKWPNDVIAARGKLAGILVETAPLPGSGLNAVVVGIGVNVGQKGFPDAAGFSWPPTSIALETEGLVPTVEAAIEAVSAEMTSAMARMGTWDGWTGLMDEWRGCLKMGLLQSGRAADGTLVSGILRDVRASDGAALLGCEDRDVWVWPDCGDGNDVEGIISVAPRD